MTLALFDADPPPAAPPPAEKLSPDRLRTQRQHDAVARGVHPLALVFGPAVRVHQDADRSCGNCRFRAPGRYPKCMYGYGRVEIPATKRYPGGPTYRVVWPRGSHGPATDVRAWWPACTDHEPAGAEA
jgi:hypothetical protein